MKRKKIIFVTTTSSTVLWHLRNIVERAVIDFDVYIIGDNVTKYSQSFPNINMINLKIERKPRIFLDFIALVKLLIYFFKINPDISHSIMPKSGLLTSIASRLAYTPIRLHTFTGQVWVNYTGVKRILYKLIDLVIIKLNTLCLTDSLSQSNYLFINGIKYKNKPLPVNGNGSLSGVDINFANIKNKPNELRKQLGIEKENFVFTYIARKTRDKGAIDMLEAFGLLNTQHPNKFKLLFIGPCEDDAVEDYLNLKEFSINNVINIDAVANHFDYINISNILCLPSHREGFGTIVIDAAAMGIPAIGYDIPGLADSIVDNETGILVPEGDIHNFSTAMERLYLDKSLREQLGQSALSRFEKYFTADLIYAGLRKVYNGGTIH